MQNRRAARIFLVGKDQGIVNNAYDLANQFYPDSESKDEAHIANLSHLNCFGQLTETDFQQMVFLGHGNPGEYGGYTAKNFARQMSEQFQYKEDKKKLVKDLYLIGCDMGLINEEGRSLAQEIANELFNNGFTNVNIHSVAQPEGAVGEALYVEVLEKLDEAGIVRNKTNEILAIPKIQPGFISAYLFNQEDGDKFFELLKDKKKNVVKLSHLKSERAFVFVNEANPVIELNKPHNIFVPHETPELRQQRIASHPYTKLSQEQNDAIELLKQRREYENSKKHKTMVKKLDFIITQVSRAQPEDWQSLIKRFKPYLEERLLGIKLNPKSNTFKLLNHLSKGDFDAARKVIGKQKEAKKSDKKHSKVEVVGVIKQKTHLGRGKSDKKLTHKKMSGSGGDTTSPSHEENQSPSDLNTRRPLRDLLKLNQAKIKIKALMDIYDARIQELSGGCFSCFSVELTTKMKKYDALEDLYNRKSFADMQIRAYDYMTSSEHSRVMRSWSTSTTADLLDVIVNKSDTLVEGQKNEDISINSRGDDFKVRV